MKKIIAAIVLLPLLTLACINQFAPQLVFDAAMQAARSAAGMQAHNIKVGEYNYAYLDSGADDSLPTIIFVHGFGAEKDNWPRMAAFLSGDYRLVAIDLLGHGDSDKPREVSYKISAQMERLHSVIKAIDLPAFHMIGNSMGGHIAGMYAARHPEGVLSVTLLNNGGILSPVIADAWQATAAGEPNPLIIRSVDDIDRFLDYVMVEKPFMTQSIKEHFAKLSMAKQELNDYIFDFLRDENFEDLALELPKITAPVQIIWGEDDRILHVSSIDVMKPLLQNETIVILPNTGHGPMMERPQKTAEALDSFIKNL